MSFNVNMNCDNVDQATLRIDCASNLLTMIHIQLSGECDQPVNSVIASALYGIHLLVDDAHKLLGG